MKQKFLIAVIICSFLWILFPANSFAVGYSFKFQPTNMDLNTTQGDRFKEDIVIQNNSNSPLNATVYIRNFKAIDGIGTVSFYQPSSKLIDMSSWVTPEISNISIAANDTLYETLDFTIPDYIKSGSYTGVIFIEPIQTSIGSINGSGIYPRAGINLILNVYKNQAEYNSLYKQGNPENINVPYINFNNTGISGDIKNKGDFFVSDNVSINIYNILGKSVKTLSYPEVDIVPNGYRYLDGKSKQVLIEGLGPNIYKADVVVKDNLKGTQTIYTLYFTIWSLSSIIGIIVILAILSFIIYAIYRKSVYRQGKYIASN